MVDGRDLWLFNDRYPVAGLVGWLQKEGIDAENVAAVLAFTLVDEMGRGDLHSACVDFLKQGLEVITSLVGMESVEAEILAKARMGKDGADNRRKTLEVANFFGAWKRARANGEGGSAVQVRHLMVELNLEILSRHELNSVIVPLGLITAEEYAQFRVLTQTDVQSMFEGVYEPIRGLGPVTDAYKQIAVHGEGPG